MITKDLLSLLIELKAVLAAGGAAYKRASQLLEQEATTENIKEIKEFLDQYWRNRWVHILTK